MSKCDGEAIKCDVLGKTVNHSQSHLLEYRIFHHMKKAIVNNKKNVIDDNKYMNSCHLMKHCESKKRFIFIYRSFWHLLGVNQKVRLLVKEQ